MNARNLWAGWKAHRFAHAFTILVTLAIGILIGTVVSYGVRGQEKSKSSSASATPLTVPSPRQMSNTFSQIAKTMEPSVVNINTESTIKNVRRRRGPGGGGNQAPFEDFFDRFFGGPGGGQSAPGGRGGQGDQGRGQGDQGQGDDQGPDVFGGPDGGGVRERSLGSGVIVDPKGYIVTNRHVVEKADRIRVKLM